MMRVCATVAAFCLLTLAPDAGANNGSTAAPVILPVARTGWPRILASTRGHVTLVNFWATWCAPCVEEFPDLLKLREAYASRGLRVVFVSLDTPGDTATAVRGFLEKHGVGFTTYIKSAGDDEAFINTVDRNWRGAIPATFIYDRRGREIHALTDAHTFKQLARLIEPLLQK